MIHPSTVAQDHIFKVFSNCFFDANTVNTNKKIDTINKNINHDPLIKDCIEYKDHLQKTLNDISNLESINPLFELKFDKEKEYCKSKISEILL